MLRSSRIGPYLLSESARDAALKAHYRKEYPMMKSPVLFARSERLPLRRKWIAGKEVVAMQEGELRFRVPKGSSKATGLFGASPDPHRLRPGATASQGFAFAVTYVGADAKRATLFTRYLYAYEREADRGFQSFSVDLSPESEGILVLGVQLCPPGSDSYPLGDWAFWTDIEVR